MEDNLNNSNLSCDHYRREFLESPDVKRFLDNNLMREIYSDEEVTIFNVAEDYYSVIFERVLATGGYGGYAFGGDVLREIVNAPFTILHLFNKASLKDKGKLFFSFEDRLFDFLVKLKHKHDINGASPYIDYEFEEELKNKRMTL